MSLFTSEPAQNHSLYNGRRTFESSESEPLPSDASTEGSTASEENITASLQQKIKEKTENKDEEAALNGELSTVKSFEECKECNGKSANDALSQENIQLLKNIKYKEKKLRDTRRQLNEERAFYEQQKLDLCKTISKKKSRSQVIQTDDSALETTYVVQELETEIAGLKRELEKEVKRATKLKEKCHNLKKRNGQLKSEISLNEEDYEKSWKEVRDKLETYKRECGTAEKNSGIIKNIYDQVLKKNAYLARSNFALQAELRRLYRKFECLDKSTSLKRLTSKSTIPSASSPDLWRRQKEETCLIKKKRMWRSKTAPSRTNAEESSENLVVSGSLISVHVEGDEKRLRPVFLVLDDKKKSRSRRTFFGVKQDANISDSSPAIRHDNTEEETQREKDTIIELKDVNKEINEESMKTCRESENELSKNNTEERAKSESNCDKTKIDTTLQTEKPEKVKNKNERRHKQKRKTKDSTGQKQKIDGGELLSDKNPGNESPRKVDTVSQPTDDASSFQEVAKTTDEQMTEKNHAEVKNETDQELETTKQNGEVESDQAVKLGNITDNRCSDSENVIVECRTHSSSVQ